MLSTNYDSVILHKKHFFYILNLNIVNDTISSHHYSESGTANIMIYFYDGILLKQHSFPLLLCSVSHIIYSTAGAPSSCSVSQRWSRRIHLRIASRLTNNYRPTHIIIITIIENIINIILLLLSVGYGGSGGSDVERS